MDDLDFKADPIDGYKINLRSAVRLLWSAQGDWADAWLMFQSAIRRAFTQAWLEGAKAYGISEEELTAEERTRLETEIAHETSYIGKFIDAIEAGSKANGGKLTPLLQRTELWVKGYERIRQLAKVYAAKDEKQEWIYGDTVHCEDCLRYNGRLYRASIWKKYNIQPKMYSLACHGFHCQCKLEPTDKKATPGRPPLPSGARGKECECEEVCGCQPS